MRFECGGNVGEQLLCVGVGDGGRESQGQLLGETIDSHVPKESEKAIIDFHIIQNFYYLFIYLFSSVNTNNNNIIIIICED